MDVLERMKGHFENDISIEDPNYQRPMLDTTKRTVFNGVITVGIEQGVANHIC